MNTESLVKNMYKAFTERDMRKLELICHPDIRWEQALGFPGGTVSKGIEQIIQNVYIGNSQRWDYFSFKAQNFISTQKHVLVQGHYEIQSQTQNSIIKVETAHLFEIQNNQIIEFKQYTDTKMLWDHYQTKGA